MYEIFYQAGQRLEASLTSHIVLVFMLQSVLAFEYWIKVYVIFNRPGVAGAVLQTVVSLISHPIPKILKTHSLPKRKS